MDQESFISEFSTLKKRKTTTDRKIHKRFDLNNDIDEIHNELENESKTVDFIFQTSRKRKFHQIKSTFHFISHIPRPNRHCTIRYSKYKDFVSKIPRAKL